MQLRAVEQLGARNSAPRAAQQYPPWPGFCWSASSWGIGAGLRRKSLYCFDCAEAYACYRAGKAFAFSEEASQRSSWGAQLDFKHQNALDGKYKRSIIGPESRCSIGDQLNLRAGIEQHVDGEDIFETSLSLEKHL